MAARKTGPGSLDRGLGDLPPELRWREWMGRVEAVIFAAPEPVPREVLSRLVGPDCRLDDLIADIQAELRTRPYELVFVAGGWHHRTRARFAEAIRSVRGSPVDAGAPALTPTERLIVTAIAYLQPVSRGDLARLLGKEVSRDLIARLKRLDLIGAGPRLPQPGSPLAYVTTPTFLAVFGLGSLRDLPDIEALEDAGLLARPEAVDARNRDLDRTLGLEADGVDDDGRP